jgi:DUF4097 and DUF4098 domain-containing protein YvlB
MREFDTPEPIVLSAKVPGGTLTVAAEPRTTATVHVTPYDDSEASRDAADRTLVQLDGDALVVEVPEPGWRLRRGGRVRVDVRLPEDSRLNVKVASADARLTGRYGDCVVDTASGDVEIGHVAGILRLHAASGDVRVDRVDRELALDTASGDVTLGYTGADATVRTASGDVALAQAGSSLRVKTASGDLRVDSVRQGAVALSTSSGDVRVGVVAGTSVWLDLATAAGSTRSDLQQVGAPPASGKPDLTLQVRTASGDIELRRVALPTAA